MSGFRKPLLYVLGVLFLSLVCGSSLARDSAPHWTRVSSSHFSVLTDADQDKGREVVVRFEQMRTEFGDLLNRNAVRMPVPLDIIAYKTADEFTRMAPAGETSSGFFLAGEDRNFIVLDLSREESWRTVAKDLAFILLNGNYPPTQPWFDEGFAEYFSSFRPGDKQLKIGDDPSSGAFTTLLSKEKWLSVSDLFASQKAAQSDQFRAQAWMTMHYLISKDKLSETGTYLGLVETEKLPVEQAIQQAYGMSPDQLGQAVKDYFQTLAPKFSANTAATSSAGDTQNIGSSVLDVKQSEAQAALAEVEFRVPGKRPLALSEIQAITNDPKQDNAIAHRALAWDHIQRNEFDEASEQLNEALRLDPRDAWVRYYLSLLKYKKSQNGALAIQGLPNMMQDLRIVLDWNPEFAEAYNLLGIARLQGGGINAAMESMHAAIQLSPRNETYLLNMANIYLSGKKWDAATALLERLAQSPNPEMIAVAKKKLTDLPALKKYGRVPEAAPATADATKSETAAPDSDEVQVSTGEALPPPPDKRPIQYAKGKLLSVDCSHAPVALLSVTTGTKKLTLRTEDYKFLVVVGADSFSCAWTNRAVSVNYKPGGKSDGDLVSLEIK